MGAYNSKPSHHSPSHHAAAREKGWRREVHERIDYPMTNAIRDLEKGSKSRGRDAAGTGRSARREVQERVGYPMMDRMRERERRGRSGGGEGGGWGEGGEERWLGRGGGVGERMGRFPGGWRWGV